MLTFLLKRDGHVVEGVADGVQAIERAAAFNPEVVILDIGMPKQNGYEVAKRLREMETGTRPYLIALSGLGQAEDKTRAYEAGFDHHFTKPVDINALLGLLAERRG